MAQNMNNNGFGGYGGSSGSYGSGSGLSGNYYNAARGLKIKFLAELIAIVCNIIYFIPFLGTIIGLYGMLTCYIISVYGLYLVSRDVAGCQTAFFFSIAEVVFTVARLFSGNLWFLDIISSIVSFLALFLLCQFLSADLLNHGMREIVDKGEVAWKINLICAVVSILVSIMMLIPFINILGALLGAVTAIASIIGSALYFVYLYKSAKFYETC